MLKSVLMEFVKTNEEMTSTAFDRNALLNRPAKKVFLL